MTNVREKQHRLPAHLYRGFVIVAFTVCVKNRAMLFTDQSIVRRFEEILMAEAKRFYCEVLVYLFMPDHLHAIFQGKTEQASPLDAMNRFKQKTGFWLAKNRPSIHWQKDYYDHVIRKEEDISKHIRYVLDNPVRRSIVEDWTTYRFSGSTIYKLDELAF